MRVHATLLLAAASGLLVAAGGGMLLSSRLEPGAWQLRPTGGAGEPMRVCVRSVDDLVQLRHPGRVCSRYVVANEAGVATIHYSCAGAGYGRTTVRAETGQLARVESQGLAGQSPFEIAYEARRTGPCAAPRRRR